MYLVIKELSTVAEDVIIVTSSLQKDMNAKGEQMYRSNAVRALCKITDVHLTFFFLLQSPRDLTFHDFFFFSFFLRFLNLYCIQSSLIAGIERFLKQAIVDKQTSVASAALVSSMHLWAQNKEVVKRWVNEVQEAMNNKGETRPF